MASHTETGITWKETVTTDGYWNRDALFISHQDSSILNKRQCASRVCGDIYIEIDGFDTMHGPLGIRSTGGLAARRTATLTGISNPITQKPRSRPALPVPLYDDLTHMKTCTSLRERASGVNGWIFVYSRQHGRISEISQTARRRKNVSTLFLNVHRARGYARLKLMSCNTGCNDKL